MDIDLLEFVPRGEPLPAGDRGAAAGRPHRSWARGTVAGLAVLLVLSSVGSPMAQGRRLALVVGNDAYRAQSVLRNAVNDARAVASALGEVGFAVTRVENADRSRLTSALSSFAGSLRPDDVALFYFAGHGVQVDQENYLMPTDYAGQTSSALRFDAVSASDVQEMLGRARVAMLVFDACRNNPYRGVRGGTGLAPMEARGTLVAYAAGAGEVAADSAPGASNGLFTSKFVEALRTPGLTATDLFRRVRRDVYEASNAEQWPAVYDDLLSDFVFRPSASAGIAPSVAAPPAGATAGSEAALGLDRAARRRIQRGLAEAGFDPGPADGVFGPGTRAAIRRWQAARGATSTGYLDGPSAAALGAPASSAASGGAGRPASTLVQQETVFWQSIQGSTDPADFEAYLELFANGTFSRLARNRLASLGGSGDAPRPGGGVRDGEAFRDCPSCPELVAIPAGEFLMGSPASEEGRDNDEGPQRWVRVERFALGRYEVTRGEYAAFAAATGRDGDRCGVLNDEGTGWQWSDRASWRSPGFPQTAEDPAVCVSWDDARAYVRWLSGETGRRYRLPSESEWEYAARAGTSTSRYWGEGPSGQCGNANGADAAAKQRFDWNNTVSCNDGRVFTAPVGTFAANRFGLFDMLGNVWEWVEDCWHDSYQGAPSDARAWTSGGDCGRRVLRGGSWVSLAENLRSGARGWYAAGSRRGLRGFRVSRTLD